MTAIHPRPLLGNPPRDGDRPYLALNMVATVDGRVALNGSAVGIGSAEDRHLLRELRAEADVVLHGAGTVRADRLSARVPPEMAAERVTHGLTEQPIGAIVTESGKLPAEHPYYDSDTLVYVLSSGDVPVRARTVEVVRVATVRDVLADLSTRGARRVVCEGGPTLNHALCAAGLVDEIFLTIAPKLIGGEHPLTLIRGASLGVLPLRLRSLVELDGELFLKYGVEAANRR